MVYSGKSTKNGWWRGVPLWLRKPPFVKIWITIPMWFTISVLLQEYWTIGKPYFGILENTSTSCCGTAHDHDRSRGVGGVPRAKENCQWLEWGRYGADTIVGHDIGHSEVGVFMGILFSIHGGQLVKDLTAEKDLPPPASDGRIGDGFLMFLQLALRSCSKITIFVGYSHFAMTGRIFCHSLAEQLS